jgi:hypothetical protein
MLHHRRPSPFLRTLLLVLVALGVVIQPMLAIASELHGVDHAAVVIGDAGHEGHQHDDDGQPEGGDPNHAFGLHGLMHQGSAGASSLPPMFFTLAAVPQSASVLSWLDDTAPSGPPLGQVHRPPIA